MQRLAGTGSFEVSPNVLINDIYLFSDKEKEKRKKKRGGSFGCEKNSHKMIFNENINSEIKLPQ